jgi:hypothetical protein
MNFQHAVTLFSYESGKTLYAVVSVPENRGKDRQALGKHSASLRQIRKKIGKSTANWWKNGGFS